MICASLGSQNWGELYFVLCCPYGRGQHWERGRGHPRGQPRGRWGRRHWPLLPMEDRNSNRKKLCVYFILIFFCLVIVRCRDGCLSESRERAPGTLTESQNHRIVGVGRDLCGSSSPTLLLKQGHPQQAAQDLVQAGLEYLQRRRLHSLPGQPGPGLRHPQMEEVLPRVQLELPVPQFVPIAPCPLPHPTLPTLHGWCSLG